MSYPAHDSYKNSGVEWLGDVPSGWETWKISHGFRSIGSGTTPNTNDLSFYNGDIPWVTTAELREKRIVQTNKTVTDLALKEYSALSIYSPNALIIAMYGATIGRLGTLGVHATVNQACCVFENPIAFDSTFVFWWLQMARPVLVTEATGGGQPNLSQDDLKSLKIPAPNVSEQKAIALFLDRKAAAIDALIAKKEKLLELLVEKRTALITRAVTKGLDPTVPMEPSGIDWLGDVPEGWEVKKLKYLSSANDETLSDTFDPDLNITYVDISSVDLIEGIKRKETLRFGDAPSRARRVVKHGDTIISTVRTYLKAIAAIKEPEPNLIVSTGFCVIRPIELIAPDFLGYCLRSEGFIGEVVSKSVGVSYPAINPDGIVSIKIINPPMKEQKVIADYLANKISDLDAAKQKIYEAILKLKEYRTALITAAVTGKIRVT